MLGPVMLFSKDDKQTALFILTISLCATLEEETIIPLKDEK